MLTGSQLERLLYYDPDEGSWTWTQHHSVVTQCKGREAGNVRPDGYRTIRIGGVRYYSGRLAFLWMLGYWPEEVDHIDRDPSNDRWSNLREATSSDNKANSDRSALNTSGYRGVGFVKRTGKWRVDVNASYLGAYDTIEEAIIVRDAAAKQIQGEFADLILSPNRFLT